METTISWPAVPVELFGRVDRLVVSTRKAYGMAREYGDGSDDLYLLYGIIRARVVHDAAAGKGDQHQEGPGREHCLHHDVIEQGFRVAGSDRVRRRHAGRVVV